MRMSNIKFDTTTKLIEYIFLLSKREEILWKILDIQKKYA